MGHLADHKAAHRAGVCGAPYVDEMRKQLAREREWDEAPANVFASTRP